MAVSYDPRTGLSYNANTPNPTPTPKQVPVSAAQKKAEAIMAADEARIAAYQDALTAPAKTAEQVANINAAVQAETEASGNVYNPSSAMTVANQVSINPNVKTTQNYSTGTPVDTLTPKTLGTSDTSAKQVDSIAAITALLSSYGIGELGPAITAAVMKGYSTDTIQLIMQDPNSNDPLAVAFQTRFPANKARLAAGKSVLSAGEYLAAERSYTQVMQSYGVANLATRDRLNQFITNDISASEVADRVSLAVNRVQNADASTKEALKQFYPMLNQSDIVGAVLDPTEGLPSLQRKITIGEIGGAALAQNLKDATGKIDISMGASALADLGVTQAKAREGFQQVAELTPRGNMLSDISTTGQKYGQLQAEQEAFQGLASAKRARLALTAEEQARFQASAGNIKGAPPHTFSDSGAY
jgi:hypothetical protein